MTHVRRHHYISHYGNICPKIIKSFTFLAVPKNERHFAAFSCWFFAISLTLLVEKKKIMSRSVAPKCREEIGYWPEVAFTQPRYLKSLSWIDTIVPILTSLQSQLLWVYIFQLKPFNFGETQLQKWNVMYHITGQHLTNYYPVNRGKFVGDKGLFCGCNDTWYHLSPILGSLTAFISNCITLS